MANEYESGDMVRIRTTTKFQDSAGSAFDPDTVTFSVKEPGKDVVTYIYGTDSEVSKLATGDYACDINVATRGTWYYHIKGVTSGDNRGGDQGEFAVAQKKAS